MDDNLRFLESVAPPIFDVGHIPMIGEWVALPIMNQLGSIVGDDRSLEILTPTAELPGSSAGADNDVRIANQLGIPVYTRVAEIPSHRDAGAQ